MMNDVGLQRFEPVSEPAAIPSIESLASSDRPFVLADSRGNVLRINAAFEHTYGWTSEALCGEPLSHILPDAFQMAHQLGFSRFQSTGHSTILAHPLELATICHDGSTIVSEHFIVAERQESGEWVFGATLTPLEPPDRPEGAGA